MKLAKNLALLLTTFLALSATSRADRTDGNTLLEEPPIPVTGRSVTRHSADVRLNDTRNAWIRAIKSSLIDSVQLECHYGEYAEQCTALFGTQNMRFDRARMRVLLRAHSTDQPGSYEFTAPVIAADGQTYYLWSRYNAEAHEVSEQQFGSPTGYRVFTFLQSGYLPEFSLLRISNPPAEPYLILRNSAGETVLRMMQHE